MAFVWPDCASGRLSMLAKWLADVGDTQRFKRVESLCVRTGLLVLGIGLFAPAELLEDIGFGVLVVAFLVNMAASLARRSRSKNATS